MARLREIYGDAVFAAMVPESVDFVEAIAQRKPIAAYKPRGAAAKAIKALGRRSARAARRRSPAEKEAA